MEIGRFVQHTRSPHYGIGKVVATYCNGSCRVIFSNITINGALISDLKAVSMSEQDQLELEEARREGPEAMAEYKKRQKQREKDRHEKTLALYHRSARFGFSGPTAYFDEDLGYISMQAEAVRQKSQPAPEKEETNPAGANTNWWYQAFKQDEDFASKQVVETRVAGVTYENRQPVIAAMEKSEQIILEREPDNPFDCNAISVKRKNGFCIGYLPRQEAERLAGDFDAYGKPVQGTVTAILGKYLIDSFLGLRIRFSIPCPESVSHNRSDGPENFFSS